MNQYREDLKAYVDGELSPARTQELEQAMKADPALLDEANMLKRIKESFVDHTDKELMLREARVDPRKAQLISKLREAPARKGVWSRMGSYRWVAAMAVGIALFATFVPTYQQTRRAGGGVATAGASMEMASAPAMPMTEMDLGVQNAPAESEAKATADYGRIAERARVAPSKTRGEVPTLRSEREVIQSASIGVAVESAYKGLNQVNAIAISNGGYLDNKNYNKNEGGAPVAMATIKVPAAKYDMTMERVRELGEVREESQAADDVTKQAVAYRAEIDQLKRKINALDARLRTARGREASEIRWRLSDLQGQLNSQQVASKQLAGETAISTIVVNLYEKDKIALSPENQNWSNNIWNQAANNFTVVGRGLGAVAVNILVFSPIWLPFALIVWWKNRAAKK
ncbi:MAG: DUF4349 domain-containing protein [Chthonomonas sp.]|nr:DUF4349 domain-containing protein [Chthonomonas sp.]